MTPRLTITRIAFAAFLTAAIADAALGQTPPTKAKKQDQSAADADASRPAVLMCTTMLHLDPGRAGPKPARPPVRIRLRYRAIPLSAETLEAIRTNARARAFYNGRVLRRLGRFANDLPVKVGKVTLKPSTWDAGFVCLAKGRWLFVVLDRDGQAAATAPLTVTAGETEIPCLNLSLVPAPTPGRATLAVRYGTMRGRLDMTLVRPKDGKKASKGEDKKS